MPTRRQFLYLSAATAAETRRERMDARIRAAIAAFQGSVSLYAKNLSTSESYGIREDERVRTASTIKLPIMASIFAAVERGEARFDELLTLKDSGKVSGSGVIREFSDGLRLPVRDLMHVMIVVSDNSATNLLLDRFPAEGVNREMDKLGLKQTRSLRKVMSGDEDPGGWSAAGRLAENKRFGLGVSTPREMVALLEKLHRGEVVTAAASKQMIEILKRQQYKDGIGRRLDGDWVASKSGALDHLRSDVGLVYAPGGPLAIAITADDLPKVDYSPDNAGNIFISAVTGALLEGLSTSPSV